MIEQRTAPFCTRLQSGLLRASILCVLGLALLAPLHATRAQQAPAANKSVASARTATREASTRSDGQYRIGPGDVLEIRVFERPQLSRDAVRVEDSGTIRMPLLEGEIQAACRTTGELAYDITKRYLKYQRDPHVDVFIKEYNSTPAAVIGAVNQPGRFQMQRRVRLLELLTFAGGPTEHAGRNVQVVHTAPPVSCAGLDQSAVGNEEMLEVSAFRLDDTLRGNTDANPFVRPGDVVTILDAEQAFVIGNVLKPSAIPLKETVTVSQAIAMAGGTLPDTQQERVRIIRRASNATAKTEIIVDLKAISRRSAEDIALEPNDIVEVPTASGKRFMRNLLNGIVPSVGRLPMQVIR